MAQQSIAKRCQDAIEKGVIQPLKREYIRTLRSSNKPIEIKDLEGYCTIFAVSYRSETRYFAFDEDGVAIQVDPFTDGSPTYLVNRMAQEINARDGLNPKSRVTALDYLRRVSDGKRLRELIAPFFLGSRTERSLLKRKLDEANFTSLERDCVAALNLVSLKKSCAPVDIVLDLTKQLAPFCPQFDSHTRTILPPLHTILQTMIK
jgi:hypothetical protein